MSRHAVGFTFNTVLASAVSVRVWGIVCVFCVRACVVGWPARPCWLVVLVGVGVCGGLFVICIVVASMFLFVLFFVFCLVLLGIRWMPWHQELMKDVAACDMPRGAGERALLSEGVRMGEPNLGCAGLPSSERV